MPPAARPPVSLTAASADWPPAPVDVVIAPGEVHVWRFVVPAPLPIGLAQTLAPAEHERAAQMRWPARRQEFSAARAGLRRILGGLLGMAPAAVPITLAAGGKPGLPGTPPPCWFSLTHAGAVILVAVARDRPVGIDREVPRQLPERAALIATHGAPAERAALATLPAASRDAAFAAIWAGKEAYLKGTGDGLRVPLASVCLVPPLPVLAPPDAARPRFAVATNPAGNDLAAGADPAVGQGWTGRWLLEPVPDLAAPVRDSGLSAAPAAAPAAPAAVVAVAAPGADWTVRQWTLPPLGDERIHR